MDFELKYRPFSERSILVEWPQKIDRLVLQDVLTYKNHLLNSNIKSIVYIRHTYSSILINYIYTIDKINDEILMLKSLYDKRFHLKKTRFRLWRVPVCYDEKFGLDINEISKDNNLSKSEIIKRHSGAIYSVFFIGFLPGFLYLGGLDKCLHFPRRNNPRKMVQKGAVGIGGSQTGIYPNESPGGWNIIGNSPITFFNPKADLPCFAKSGDQIEFVPINLERYHAIKEQSGKGMYELESLEIDG